MFMSGLVSLISHPIVFTVAGGLVFGLAQKYILPWALTFSEAPAIKVIKENYWVIDAILAEYPDVKQKYVNPVSAIAEALTDDKFDAGDAYKAASWAAEVFDFNIHESFIPKEMTESQKKIVSGIYNRIMR
jgi:hypothetical protein